MQNPYPTPSTPHHELHKITARVSTEDYLYIKRLLGGAITGLSDKIISNLFHKFVSEIRTYGLDPDNTDHQAWHTAHINHTLPDRILDSISFCRISGEHIGYSRGRDDERAASEICAEVQRPAEQRTDAEGAVRKGKRAGARGKKEGGKKEG